jgi:hypothetical protein
MTDAEAHSSIKTGRFDPLIEDPLGLFDVVAAYCQAYDSRDREAFAAVFADEAVVRILGGPSGGSTAVGHDAVLSSMTARWPGAPASMHLTGNLRFFRDPPGVRGTSDYLFVVKQPDGSLTLRSAGRYLDRFVRSGDRWVIAERVITALGEPYDLP